MNFLYLKKLQNWDCSSFFLIFYGIFRISAEFFREPDIQVGYLIGSMSMGMLLSALMVFAGIIIYFKRNET